MKRVYLLAFLLMMFPITCFSQIEMRDSIPLEPNMSDGIDMEAIVKSDSISGMGNAVSNQLVYTSVSYPFLTYKSAKSLDLRIPDLHFIPGQASLSHWNSGTIVAAGSTRAFPGLMQIDSGEIGIYQSAGDFRFYIGGMVNKYGYFNGLHTQYGLNGSISYQFSPRLSATVFGEYYFGQPPRMADGMPMSPSMTGYYGRSAFGGYFDFQINGRWGVQAGVQTVQQVGSNRYMAEPIVTPYYKISKKVSIGLPVGQILYNLMKRR